MSKAVVLDIETRNTFQDVGGYFPTKLDLSVVCAYFYEDDSWESYTQETLQDLFIRLEQADSIIGYNSIGFDVPILNKYYAGDFLKIPQIDMLEKIRLSLGFRIKLDDVASATIGAKKSAHGLQAVAWWKEGKVQEIIDYCMQDVKVTKEVFEFGVENGFILFDDRGGERKKVDIDFSVPKKESSGINLTMGF
ncbi:helicase [Candidatus Uhrbacteria bacterium]|jgi:DEAD/DEAH box helicase domain-containing protein|nr:helicase [Candidatus Uhrbacteria bacterium]